MIDSIGAYLIPSHHLKLSKHCLQRISSLSSADSRSPGTSMLAQKLICLLWLSFVISQPRVAPDNVVREALGSSRTARLPSIEPQGPETLTELDAQYNQVYQSIKDLDHARNQFLSQTAPGEADGTKKTMTCKRDCRQARMKHALIEEVRLEQRGCSRLHRGDFVTARALFETASKLQKKAEDLQKRLSNSGLERVKVEDDEAFKSHIANLMQVQELLSPFPEIDRLRKEYEEISKSTLDFVEGWKKPPVTPPVESSPKWSGILAAVCKLLRKLIFPIDWARRRYHRYWAAHYMANAIEYQEAFPENIRTWNRVRSLWNLEAAKEMLSHAEAHQKAAEKAGYGVIKPEDFDRYNQVVSRLVRHKPGDSV